MTDSINFDQIPQALKDIPQWVLWREELKDDKKTKIPYTWHGTRAESDNPATWGSFEQCAHVLNNGGRSTSKYNGIGFVVSQNDEFIGGDIDHCRNPQTGELNERARQIISTLDTYFEISPSGEGVRFFLRGKLPGSRKRKGNFEMYDQGRFLTVTGNHVEGTPATVEPRQSHIDLIYREVFGDNNSDLHERERECNDDIVNNNSSDANEFTDADIILKLTSAKNGEKFTKLFYGDTTGYPSQSECDLALCGLISFYTKDKDQIDRIFRQSKLYRAKWDERHGNSTYGEMTIHEAIHGNRQSYIVTSDKEQCRVITYFDGDGRFVPKWLADDILKEHHFFTFEDTREIYHYNEMTGIWDLSGENVIEAEAQTQLQDATRNHQINEVIGYIRRNNYLKRPDISPPIEPIPCDNVVLNYKTGETMPYTPYMLWLGKLAIRYDPTAKCSEVMRFIESTFNPSDLPMIQEWFGYLLYRDHFIKKALMLLGDGDNGKTIFLLLQQAFLGESNTCSESMQSLCYGRFSVANLYQKYANIYDDLPNVALTTVGNFKMATGNGIIRGEKKMVQTPINFRSFAKHTYAANELPYIKDTSSAAINRWLLCEPPYTFVDDPHPDTNEQKRDPYILEKITTPEELSGLLNWALEGLKRLLEQGSFTDSPASRDVKRRWVALTDSLRYYVDDEIEPTLGAWISKEDFFDAYQTFCDENALMPIDKQQVGLRLPTLIKTSHFRPHAKGKRITAWKDIRFKTSEKDIDDNDDDSFTPRDVTNGQCGHTSSQILSAYAKEEDIYVHRRVEETPDRPDHTDSVSINLHTSIESEYTTVLPTADISTFAGSDGNSYTLHEGDAATIPKDNADVLIKRGLAIAANVEQRQKHDNVIRLKTAKELGFDQQRIYHVLVGNLGSLNVTKFTGDSAAIKKRVIMELSLDHGWDPADIDEWYHQFVDVAQDEMLCGYITDICSRASIGVKRGEAL